MARSIIVPRQRLLEAGLRLFANRGYAGTSVHAITAEARVTKPTLYYYFHSKEGLYHALLEQAMDERLQIMRDAAAPEKGTVDQLTDLVVAVTNLARTQPDVWRLSFAVAFAATEEMPNRIKNHQKFHESLQFVRNLIGRGQSTGALSKNFHVNELTQAFFHLIQQSVVMTVLELKFRQMNPSEKKLFPRMEPRRMVELFLCGAAETGKAGARRGATGSLRPAVKRTALAGIALLALGLSALHADPAPASPVPTPATTNLSLTNVPAGSPPTNAAASTSDGFPTFSSSPAPAANEADYRPVPAAVRASHPELATVSPIAANMQDRRALDLQTCFQMTAVRDDSLKISVQDIEVARAQLSESIANLWPTFTASNTQSFLHYRSKNGGIGYTSNGVPIGGGKGNRNYESETQVNMNFTLLDGGQNWNTVGASAAAVAARRQTLARDYQTIYQDVAQAFYQVLQYEGDIAIQSDLIEALRARVEDLKGRVSLGRSRPSELLQAQTDLANAKVTVEQQKGSYNAARETLAFYIGVPGPNFTLKDTQKFPEANQLEAYVQKSGQRPDVLAQVESLRQAQRNLSVAKGALFPTVSASGSWLATQDPASNQIDATMSLEVSMPLFDGGLIISRIHENKELVRQSLLNVEQLQRTADQDTRTAYVNFTASISQVIVLREAAILAAKNLEAQVDDYLIGVVDNLSVLTALQDYQSARQLLHNSNMQARLNLINLNVAAGLAATGPHANNQALPSSPSQLHPQP